MKILLIKKGIIDLIALFCIEFLFLGGPSLQDFIMIDKEGAHAMMWSLSNKFVWSRIQIEKIIISHT